MSGQNYQQPNLPTQANYQSNPNQYNGFDRSGLAQSAIAQGNAAGANQMAQAKAQMAATGGGKSSAANTQALDLAGRMGANNMNIQNQQALQGWQDKLEQMNSQNQFNLGEQGLQNQAYGQQGNFNMQQNQQRQNMLNNALGSQYGGIANLFTNY